MILYAEKYGNCMTESVGRIILSYNKDNNSYKNKTSVIHTIHTMTSMMTCIWTGIMMMTDIIVIRITLMVWMML